MKQINFTMSFSCTDEQFLDTKTQNMLSDQFVTELKESAEKSGYEEVEARWSFEDLN